MGHRRNKIGLTLTPADLSDELRGKDARQDDDGHKEQASQGDEEPVKRLFLGESFQFLVILHEGDIPQHSEDQHQHDHENEEDDGSTDG